MDLIHSDFDNFSEVSGSEDQEDIEFLYGPQACNIFSSLEESIQKIDDLLMFERGYLNGDVVCLVSDPLGQMGKVVNVDVSVDVETMFGTKIQNVNSRYLQKIRSVSVGDCVIYGPWLGKVERVIDHVTILFDDGSKCQFSAEGPERIIALSPDFIEDSPYPFCPGQRVRVESLVSRSTCWFCDIREDKQEQGTVCNVDAGLVYVDWLYCAVLSTAKGPTPPCLQDLKNLSVLPSYPLTNWQLGDWCLLPVEQSLPSSYASGLFKGQKQSEMLISREDLSANYHNIAAIMKTKTKVDVLWQDGSQSLGLDSCLVLPVNIVDAHDFWPDAFVLENGTVNDPQVPASRRWGIIRCVNPKERTVKVKWCKSSLDLLDPEYEEEQLEEIVSAYELVEHPDYCCNLGEIVCMAEKGILDLTDGDFLNHTVEKTYLEVVNSGDQTAYLNKKFMSYFGTVIGFKQGAVQVQWGTGAISMVAPYEICRVDKCESTTTSVFSEETVQPPAEKLPVKNQLLGQKLKDVVDLNKDNEKKSSSHSISQATLGVLAHITSSVFGSLGTSLFFGYRCISEVEDVQHKPYEEEALVLWNLNLDSQLPVVDNVEMPEKITSLQIKQSNDDITLPSGSKHSESFRQFDMVNDCSDHHFVNESGMNLQSPQVKRAWLKKVNQEWSILERDLPETVYVRVYEERMDLLRAAILGTDGTPYHDGVFFFDIYLPPHYPNEPPLVFYNSGGLCINPNLYESGKVCLSLLNTWTGSESEVWNPESSTILQVLLSLQALVLNEKPYFNEAGYDMQIGKADGEKNSFSYYNENVFLVNCRYMLYLLCKPPKHFEELVDEHFRSHCKNILLACKAYMHGAPIGHPFDCGKSEERVEKGSSTGFKILLAKLYSRLVEIFSEKGIDCCEFLDQVT